MVAWVRLRLHRLPILPRLYLLRAVLRNRAVFARLVGQCINVNGKLSRRIHVLLHLRIRTRILSHAIAPLHEMVALLGHCRHRLPIAPYFYVLLVARACDVSSFARSVLQRYHTHFDPKARRELS